MTRLMEAVRIDRISAAHISDLAEHAEVIRARLDWLDQNHAALEAVKAGAGGIKVETTLTNPVTGKKAKVVEFITPSPEGEAICDIGKRLEAARFCFTNDFVGWIECELHMTQARAEYYIAAWRDSFACWREQNPEPDLQALAETYGGLGNVPPDAWTAFDRERADWLVRYRDHWAKKTKARQHRCQRA